MSSTTITGNQIAVFQLLAIKSAMDLERLGMKHSKGVSAHKVAKQILGVKGNKEKIYTEFCKYLAEVRKGSST